MPAEQKAGEMKREMTMKQGNVVCYPAPFEFHSFTVLNRFDLNILASFWQNRGSREVKFGRGEAGSPGKSADREKQPIY